MAKKMDEEVIDKSLRRFGLRPSDGADVNDKALLVTRYVERKVKADDRVVCDPGCGGLFSSKWRECPYCGEVDDSITEEETPAVALTSEVVSDDEIALDEALEQLADIRKRGAGNQWEFCVAIKTIYESLRGDRRLWECRVLPGSKKYTWADFCARELNVSSQMSYFYMDIARHYTRAAFEEVGVSKLSVILKLPPEEQKAMVASAAGKTLRALKAEVKAKLPAGHVRKTEGRKHDRTKGVQAAAEVKAKARAKNERAATATFEKKATTLSLYARDKKQDVKGGKARRPAKKMADEPWAVELCENGVEIHYRLFAGDDGGWRLRREIQVVAKE